MASKYLQKFPIPSGFQEILSDFTRQVLRDQPSNIIEYAAKYFEMLQKGKKLEFNSKYNVAKDEKKYELGYNPKNAEDITKKAANITQKLNNNNRVSHVQPSAPSNKNLSNPSNHTSGTPVGTQKTLNGEQTSQYVNKLTDKFVQGQSQDNLMQTAVEQTVNIVFDKFDVDKSGFLSSREIQRFIREVTAEMNEDLELNSAQIQHFIQEVDKDKDGKISRKQLAKFIKVMLGLY